LIGQNVLLSKDIWKGSAARGCLKALDCPSPHFLKIWPEAAAWLNLSNGFDDASLNQVQEALSFVISKSTTSKNK
jgi:hypothetical protein